MTRAEVIQGQSENKRLLVAAARAGDHDRMRELTQQREQWKRLGRRFCECGTVKHVNSIHCHVCHRMKRRRFKRRLR
jgi:hypothetical protein